MKKRYSYLIRPLKITFDIIIVNLIIYVIYDKEFLNFSFLSYISVFWLLSSYFLGFYRVFRFTPILRIFTLLLKQFLIFALGYFAYFGIFREGDIVHNQFLILSSIFIVITLNKFSWYFLLNKYRALGNNFRTTIVLGFDDAAKKLIKVFQSKANMGYKYLGFFSDRNYKNQFFLGNFNSVYNYIENNEVDEIY